MEVLLGLAEGMSVLVGRPDEGEELPALQKGAVSVAEQVLLEGVAEDERPWPLRQSTAKLRHCIHRCTAPAIDWIVHGQWMPL